MDDTGSSGRGKRLLIVLALVLASSFLFALGSRLQRDDASGLGALATLTAMILILVSAFIVRRIRWWLILYVPAIWIIASISSIMFFVPAVQMSTAINTPAECRGLGQYWDQVENYSTNMNARSELVMTDSIESQREFNIVINAAEQDLRMIKQLAPASAAKPFHQQWILLSEGWIEIYHAFWDGTLTRSMIFELQEVDDELESRQLALAKLCGRYIGEDGSERYARSVQVQRRLV